jgi:hypothetical protein
MDNNRKLDSIKSWVLIIGVLAILGVAAFMISSAIRDSAQRAQEAIQPVNDLTSNLSTQVAQALHPTPTVLPDPITIVSEIRTLARLETSQFTIEKVITAETGQGTFAALFGDRLLFVAHGTVIAGIDLEKLGPEDMWAENGVLYVSLPPAEVFIATLDNDKSYVYDRETGIFTQGDINLETTARRMAEDEILKAALEEGILGIAQTNAENYLYRLQQRLGYPDIIFVQPTPTPMP